MKNCTRLYPIKKTKFKDTYSHNIFQIGANNKWRQNITGKNVIVSVIDTGVDATHPNLKDQVIDGFNFTNDYQGDVSNYNDNNGHGTHVSGIIAAKHCPDNDIVGVSPNAKILALKVLDSTGAGDVSSLIEAIHYAIDWRGPNQEKVGVINISLGIRTENTLLHDAVKRAVKAQIPVVTAAGNFGDGNIFSREYIYPGAYPEVIEVGAVDINNEIAFFTNTNEQIDIYAPGVQIMSSYLKGELISFSGTSMAAPHVSGAIALLIEQSIGKGELLKEKNLFSLLCKSAKPMNLDNKEIEGCGSLYLS